MTCSLTGLDSGYVVGCAADSVRAVLALHALPECADLCVSFHAAESEGIVA